MPQIKLSRPGDFEILGARWRALEAGADASFFQSWTWVGCEAAARFPDPVLIEGTEGDRTLALALCNRRGSWIGDTLWLAESGTEQWDSSYIEHSGPLVARDVGPDVVRALLKAAIGRLGRRLVLSGVPDRVASLAMSVPGTLERRPPRPSPYVDFARLRASGVDHAASLSANSRQQLRRSIRRYEAHGPLTLTRAGTTDEALAYLDRLAVLHQATWERRGKPGAFSVPEFTRFHRSLLARAIPRGEAELLHVTAGGVTVGYLYNFLWRGWVLAYQSGLAYPDDDSARKPGLTCHHLAINDHLEHGMAGYDFLAGDARYKTSLANASRTLSWLELGPVWRPAAVSAWLRRSG
jgi:CelD/BcsL family acetyltransferase involved in cellulose biosynthesis